MFNNFLGIIRKNQFWSFLFILIISFVPRFVMPFTNRSFVLGTEPARDLLTVKDIVINHIFPLAGFNYGYVWHIQRGPGWYYFLAIPFILGNGDPFWAKAATGLVSIATIILSFFILKSVFNIKTAVAACILLAVSPWLIEITGQIWPPYIVIFPVALFLFAMMKFLQKQQNYAVLIALSIGLMAQFEIAIAFFYIVQMIILIPFAIKYKYINYKTLFLSFFILFLSFVPNIINDLTHSFYSTGGFLILVNYLVKGGVTNIIGLFGQRIDVFTWNFRSTFSPNVFKSICLISVMYLGAYAFIKDKKILPFKKRFVLYLALTPLMKFIILFFYPGGVQAWHLLDLTVVYCFLLGIILGYFLEKPILKLLALAVLVGLIIISSIRMNEIFKNEFLLSFGVNRITQAAPVNFIFSDSKKQPFNYIILDTSQHRYDFDYLFWWYGAKKYGYQPSKNKQKVRYYILDNNDINREILPKNLTGKIIKTENFKNGYSVIKVIN